MTGEAAFYEQVARWSEIVCAFAFLIVLILIFRRYLAPAVAAARDARNAEIAAAERRRDELQQTIGVARGESEAADRDASEIRRRGELHAARERERLVVEARADAERTVRNAEGELDRQRLAARAALRVELIEKALAKARADAAARVDERTQSELVRRTVDDLAGGRA